MYKIIFALVLLFFSISLLAQDFDPINPDYTLLKQLIIEKINQKREHKSKKTLIINEALQLTADNYITRFSENKLKNNTKNKLRISKKIKKNCLANGYKNPFLDYHIASIDGINFSGKLFYFDKEDTETSTHLFIGKKPTKKQKEEGKIPPIQVKLLSYSQVADLVVKQFVTDEGTFKILNNGFDKYGFSVAVERKTLFRKRIPKIKIIMILGGNRITW